MGVMPWKTLQVLLLANTIFFGRAHAVTADEVDKHFVQWKHMSGDPGTYQFLIQVSCECGQVKHGAVIVDVRDGRVSAIRYVLTGKSLPKYARSSFAFTIDDLFGKIRSALEQKAMEVTVNWHPWGYPELIYIDRSPRSDDEERIEVVLLNPRTAS